MSWPRVLAARLRGLFGKGRMERELDDEFRFHLEMQTEDHIRAGMTRAEAQRAALRSFGGVEPVKEALRERRGFAFLDALRQDVGYGARSLVRKPGFTVAAVASLALGIGATTALFTVLNAAALRPLPYREAEQLVWMTQVLKKNSTDEVTITAHFLEWRRQQGAFVDLAGYNYQTRNLTGLDEPRQVRTAKVSESLLPLLGVQPALGRNFLKQEDYKGHEQVALLGDALWQQQFGGRRDILGQAIVLDGSPFLVVGVLPPDFVFPGPEPVQLITPLGKDEAAELQGKAGSIIFNVIGRIKPGVSLSRARENLEVLQSRLPLPAFRPTISLKMMTLREHLFGDVKRAGLLLVAAAGFLLLIACANVGNLLLSRWVQRDRELAIRSALGGSRSRLVCQLLAESVLLGALGCAAGITFAFWARRLLWVLSPYPLPGLRSLPFDGRVLGVALGLGMLTTLSFGLLPAFRVTTSRLANRLKAGAAAAVGRHGSLRVLGAIAAVEIATMLLLTTSAGLMVQSFWKMRYAKLGFAPERLVTATLSLAGGRYREPARRSAFAQELLERAKSLPGVELAALTRAGEIPPGDFHATNTFAIEGRVQPLGGTRPIARYPVVSPDYFTILKVPLFRGRWISAADTESAPPVAIVNQALVRRYFPDEDPIGKRVRTGGDDQPWRTIAGIVGDVKASGLASAAEPAIYLPQRQADLSPEVGLVVRTPLAAGIIGAELRQVIASLDPNQPVATIQAMDDRLSASVSAPRFVSVLLLAFAGLAIPLALVGVYSVMGCHVRWQLRELAVRRALGAQDRDVLRQVLRQASAIILPGAGVGLLGALWISRLFSGMLYEVPAHDPLTFAAVSIGLVSVALAACWGPAMRAVKADPLQLLRHD